MPRKDRDNPEYRDLNRAYQNAWYHNNRKSALETRKKRYEKLRKQVTDYKVGRGCAQCGERHPACLDFHHPDPSIKDMDPSSMLTQKGWSFEKLKELLDTFDVLCANCHRKLHYQERIKASLVGE